jgi:hypothetical protein
MIPYYILPQRYMPRPTGMELCENKINPGICVCGARGGGRVRKLSRGALEIPPSVSVADPLH